MKVPEEFIFTPFKVSKVSYRSSGRDTPRPRSGHRIVCDGVKLYCFGGFNPAATPLADADGEAETWTPQRPLFKELWSYSVARRRWQLLKLQDNMPDELASNAMCMAGDNILVFGGTGSPFGHRCSNTLLRYDTRRGGPLRVVATSGHQPPAQYGQAALCLRNHFYSVGGTNGYAYTCDVYRLNVCTMSWEAVYVCHGEDEPAGRYRHELASDGSNIYVLAGGTGERAYDLLSIPVFNIETKSWSDVATHLDRSFTPPLGPLPRKCHSAVQIRTENGVQVYVMGGSDGMSVFSDVWRLDLRTRQWTLMQQTILPKLLYFHSSAVTPEGCMYTFGGVEPQDETGRRNNDLYKVWLCIPKLSEMCWEAMLHYNPDVDLIDPSKLANAGVPVRFLDRLE